jgi:Xaa-Pro aminopeptidase
MKDRDAARAGFDKGRLSTLLGDRGVDLLLASSRHNIRYLTGGYYYPLYLWDAHTRGSQYLSFLAIPRDSPAASVYIGRPGEREVMEEAGVGIPRCHESTGIGTRPAAAKAVEVLRDLQLDQGCIALELPSLPADAYEVFVAGLPRASLVDATPILDALRAVKTPAEIELMRRGTVQNAEALAAVLGSGREGETTAHLARRVEGETRRRGLHHLYALVCAGPHFFRAPSPRLRLQRDQVLHIDAGAMLEGYITEVCRTGILGTPSALADRLLAGCRDLEAAVMREIHPGVRACDVQRAAEEFLRGLLLGRHGAFIGHGIGLVHHEDPVIDSGAEVVLESGMVISLEMEFRHEEVGHVKIEDMVVVTSTGAELLGPVQDGWIVSRG